MRRKWTQQEIDYVKANYANNLTKDIATAINRSERSIYSAAVILGIKKSPEFMKICLEREGIKLRILGAASRFKKGNVSHNKGQKMPRDMYEKVKTTFFSAGHEPHNTKYDGYERICAKDGYIYVRVNKGKFVLKHRKIWEENYGKIPKGNIIIFKDGNKLNCKIENLMMITMKENMERNRVTKYPLELQLS